MFSHSLTEERTANKREHPERRGVCFLPFVREVRWGRVERTENTVGRRSGHSFYLPSPLLTKCNVPCDWLDSYAIMRGIQYVQQRRTHGHQTA